MRRLLIITALLLLPGLSAAEEPQYMNERLSLAEIRALPGFVSREDARWFSQPSSAMDGAGRAAQPAYEWIGYVEWRTEDRKEVRRYYDASGSHLTCVRGYCSDFVPAWADPALNYLEDCGLIADDCCMGQPFRRDEMLAGYDQFATLRRLGLCCQAVEMQLEQ